VPTSPIDSATVAQQLSGQFPAWRIWKNRGIWHARRRGDFQQSYAPGAPLYALTAPDPELLRTALELQETSP
jgi:hypothetical protein